MSSIPRYQAGKDIEGAIKLSSNESNFGHSPKVKERLSQCIGSINKYPDSQQITLRAAIAEHFNVDTNQLILGNGSGEILAFIAQSLLHSGDGLYSLSALETFSLYNIVTRIQHADFCAIPLLDGWIDLKALLNKFTKKGLRSQEETKKQSITNSVPDDNTLNAIKPVPPKVVFLCNPNNPTGTCLLPKQIKSFIQEIPTTSYIVLDQAYVDFAETSYHSPIKKVLLWHPNIIVLRTFSKVFGLGGIRLGIGIANPALAESIDALRMPFNINSFAIEAGIASIEDTPYYSNTVRTIQEERNRMQNAYAELGFNCYPSQANFICLKVPNVVAYQKNTPADEMYNFFAKHKVMIRSLTSFSLPTMVRITIGTPQENTKVLEILELWNKRYRTTN